MEEFHYSITTDDISVAYNSLQDALGYLNVNILAASGTSNELVIVVDAELSGEDAAALNLTRV